MSAIDGFNQQQLKEREQYLNMRAAQIAQEKAGQTTELGAQPKAKGSRKQLIGTVIGVVAVFAILVLLVALDVI